MDPVERFRVFLRADKVAAEALAMGLAKTKGEIDETAKKTATLSLISKQTKDAQGDLARTAGETSDQQEEHQGNLANLSADLGKTFRPAVDAGIGVLNGFAESAGKAFKDHEPAGESFASTISRSSRPSRSSPKTGAPPSRSWN